MTIAPRQAYPPKGHPAVYHFDWRRGRVLPEFAMVFISAGHGEFESEETGHRQFSEPTLLFLLPDAFVCPSDSDLVFFAEYKHEVPARTPVATGS